MLQTKPNSSASSGITDDFTNIGLGTTAAGMIFGKGEGEGIVLCSDSKVTHHVTKEIIDHDYANKIVKVEENIYVVQAGNYFSAKCIAIACKVKAESYRLLNGGQSITTEEIAKTAAGTGKGLYALKDEPCQVLVAGFASTDTTPQLFLVEFGMDHQSVKHGGIGSGVKKNIFSTMYTDGDDMLTCVSNCINLVDYGSQYDEATGGSLRFVKIHKDRALREYMREQTPEERESLIDVDRCFIGQDDGYDWCRPYIHGKEVGNKEDDEDEAFYDAQDDEEAAEEVFHDLQTGERNIL